MSDTARKAILALASIYEDRARRPYGLSSVNQRAHALQSASLAREHGLPAHLVVACLLHDVGHMIHSLGMHPAAQGLDDCHEELGANWLGQFFGRAVTEPVRLHVQAKRFLCATDPTYFSRLSGDSVESLALQGGAMSDTEVAAFRLTEGWQDAVWLRRIDDCAKDPNAVTPGFADFASEITMSASS